MSKRLDGRVVVITGGAMGLGQAAAREVAKEGAKLTLVDLNAEALEQTKQELLAKHPGIEVLAVTADVSNEATVKNYVEETVKTYGRIDGFYNNAGIEGRQALIPDYDVQVFKKVIDINLMGVYYGMRYVIPVMKKQQYGRIVNTASVGGIRGVLNQVPYVASKHAVSGMTKNAALEFAREGIVANAIAPGAILTSMVEGSFKQANPDDPKKAEMEFAQGNPSKRLGKPEEIAKVISFLLCEDCSYLNGQTIAIDGGQSNSYGFIL